MSNPKRSVAVVARAWALVLLGAVAPFSGCGPARRGEAEVSVSAEALSGSDVTRVAVTVSGPGISPDIAADLVKTSGRWRGVIGAIPVGAGRTFVASAYDASNALVYSGQVTGVTITQGVPVSVFILLQQAAPPVPFANSAPRLTALVSSASQLEPGQTASLAVTAQDVDGDALSYAWTATGGTLDGASTASPAWTAPEAEGAYTLSVSVADGRGGQAGVSLVLSVVRARGSARVEAAFNTWPVVSQVTANPGQVGAGQSAALDVTAVDVDGQPLGYAWVDDCGGSLSNASVKAPTWTAPGTAPAGGACTVTVTVSDGQGGSTTGSLAIQVGLPEVPNAPPVIDLSFQSVDSVDVSGTVLLMVAGHDPEGTAVAFSWSASRGALGAPVSGAAQSQVVWTPPYANGPVTITAVVQDAGGAQAIQTFTVAVAGATGPVFIAAGWSHTLMVRGDGTLWATGYNGTGQLGDGTTTDRHDFVQVLAGASRAAGGWVHTLAVKGDGTLWGTGTNSAGQLGDGTGVNRTDFVPVMAGVVSVAVGASHTVALKADGTLWVSGSNDQGQLGDGTNTGRLGFGQVMTGVTSIAAGWYHTLALKADGTLWVTGYNNVGQLGDGTNASRNTFEQVMTGVSSVASGVYHTMVVKADGTLWATGYNGTGQLGDGTNANRNTFEQVMTGVSSAVTGNYHTMVVKADGTLWAAGYNLQGELGDGTTADHNTFQQVMAGVSSAAAGMEHTMVVKADGTLWATGDNSYGQLGDGTTTGRLSFGPVPLP